VFAFLKAEEGMAERREPPSQVSLLFKTSIVFYSMFPFLTLVEK
jgi:hypothetical protein